MLDKLDNLNSQTRILLAVTLALLFFVPYSYFYAPQPIDSNTTKGTQVSTQAIAPDAPMQEQPKMQDQDIDKIAQNMANTDIIATIDANNFTYTIDNLGRISQATLKEERYKLDSKPLELFSLSLQNDPKILEIRFSNQVLNQKAFNTPYVASSSKIDITDNAKSITLMQDLGEVIVEKIITFYPNGYYEITINIPNNYPYFISTGMRPSVENDSYVFKGVIVRNSDGTITTIEDGDQNEQSNFPKSTILAAVDRYYTTLLFNKNGMDCVVLNNSKDDPMPFISANGNIKLQGYIGPKDYRLLESIDPILTDVVEYGIITFFAKPLFLLLEILYVLVGNWGWAIVLLTLIVRIVLYPLTYKGMVSMQKLKDLAPKLKEIQQRYKGDPQKLQMHMMDLYKKHGANPMGGCLPILLQMPVFFAIYRVLYNAIELKGAEWILWIDDLSIMDQYFILPILMGATMYLQQHLTPTAFSDPMQEKIFKFLPLIFTIFFVTFPSGLVLYWFINNIFSILQQLVINKMLANKKEKEVAEHKHEKE